MDKLLSEINSLDSVDEKYRPLYEEKEGKFVLTISAPDPEAEAKVKEFRDNNISRGKEIEELKAKLDSFKDIDVEEYKKLKKELAEAEEKKALDDGDIEKAVDARVATMKKDFDNQVEQLTKSLDAANQELEKTKVQYEQSVIKEQVMQMLDSNFKVRSGALPDLLSRVQSTWRLVEGKPVAFNGEDKIYGHDGKEPMTMEEWFKSMQTQAPHLFESNKGGGAEGNREGGSFNQEKVIDKNDPSAYSQNIEGIAEGKVAVK